MALLTAAKRKSMPKKEFAQPKSKGFPLNDKTHDRMAISGATRSYNAGNISKGTENKIKAEAREKLGDKGGKAKPKSKTKAKSTPKMPQSKSAGHGMSKSQLVDAGLHTSKHFGGSGDYDGDYE